MARRLARAISVAMGIILRYVGFAMSWSYGDEGRNLLMNG